MKNFFKITAVVLGIFILEVVYIQNRLNDIVNRVEDRQNTLALVIETQQRMIEHQSRTLNVILKDNHNLHTAAPLLAER